MNTIKLNVAIAVFVLMVIGLPQNDVLAGKLQVYLPRNVVVNGEIVMLRDAAILTGDEKTVKKAGETGLCRVSRAGAEITIDKQTVMSRLASNGFNTSDVVLSGADSIAIARQGRVIKSDDFIAAAQQELEKLSKDPSICRWKAAWTPKEFTVDGTGDDVKLISKLAPRNSQSQVRVAVAVMQNGKEICVREIAFNGQYKNLRAVATMDIQPGIMISPDNVRIETFESALPQQGYAQPYGLAAKRQIKADSVVNADMLEATKSPVLVSRNQGVVIQIKQPGLTITAMGQALEDGRAKECVKVRNIDSQRVVLARVNEDGTVEPVY